MTGDRSIQPLSIGRVRGVAILRLRRLVRTRRLALATLMTMLPWLLVEQALLVARISALTEFTVVGLAGCPCVRASIGSSAFLCANAVSDSMSFVTLPIMTSRALKSMRA